MRRRMNWLMVAVLLASFLAGCAPAATPVVIEKEVPVEKPVVQTVVVEKPVVQTVVVEKGVEVPAAAGPVTLTLYNPTGAFEVTQTFAPRLDTLEGKTICEVSNNGWEAPRTFQLIRELLQKAYPTAKFIAYDQFPSGISEIDVDSIADLVKEAGCQAAIVGNAG